MHKNRSITQRIIMKLSHVQPHELKATITSFLMIFILMAAYFILRPVRDAMASDWSDAEVSFLWNLQFFISIAIVSIYGLLISKFNFKHVVPIVYGGFAISFVLFYLITASFSNPQIIEKTFYVWVSAFSLFHLSVFWSLMADTFTKEQSARLFSIIATGSSTGAIIGPMIPSFFAEKLGLETLMLIAACGLLLVIPMIYFLYHVRKHELKTHTRNFDNKQKSLGGNWHQGFKAIINNKNLMSIGCFILLYVFIGSFIYFQQKHLLAEFSRPDRVKILSSIDWVVNSLTFVLAFFVTGRLTLKFGMPLTLALMPIILTVGMFILAFAPVVVIFLALQTVRKSGNYAITRPAREMLFTQVSQQERFKAKPVIDMVIYRGGDAISGSLFAILTEGIGLGLAAVAMLGALISSIWAGLAVMLGKEYENNTLSQSNTIANNGKKY